MGRRRLLAAFPLLFLGLAADSGCYSVGDGTPPPTDTFYFPVGLQVSNGGNVLYVANSDFDLQFNGGTLQSYDLFQIRRDTLTLLNSLNQPGAPFPPALPTPGGLPYLPDRPPPPNGACPGPTPITIPGSAIRQPIGATCAPPMDAHHYFRSSAIIGAFATNLLLSPAPTAVASKQTPAGDRKLDRLFTTVRGTDRLTWADVTRDTFADDPHPTSGRYDPFTINCGQDTSGRCDDAHQIGQNPDEPFNTRHITMPGEPFGAAFNEDATALVVTHQNDPDVTLFTTGLHADDKSSSPSLPPAIQFVLGNAPIGGVGIAAIPHDTDAFVGIVNPPKPAFLETTRAAPQLSVIRQYPDDGTSLTRPFLDIEASIPITLSPSGSDSRGIAIDPTPRIACKAKVAPVGPLLSQAEHDAKIAACARKSARAFIANRTPPALLVGDVGGGEGIDAAFDPDRIVLHTSIPLANGASNVYLAPIVDKDGAYALRVFVVCYDAATVYVFDPDAGVLENVINVGVGPFSMAFDPFSIADVANHAPVPLDQRDPKLGLRQYRFAYIASFTQSYLQVLDLDNAQANPATFEKIVYTLGVPTNPKGT